MTVGSSAVVPNFRCDAAIRRPFDGRGIVIEERAATAIHLRIDETGRQQSAVKLHDVHVHRDPADIRDDSAIDDKRRTLMRRLAVEDARAGQGKAAHRVFVTFLRRRGRSGSRPRARAIRSAAP